MIFDFKRCIDIVGIPTGILHCGAYNGDDVPTYTKHGISNVLYVEPNPILFKDLERVVGTENCVQAAVFHTDNLDMFFNLYYSKDRTNLGCSSLLEWSSLQENQYLEEIGDISVQTITINTLLKNRPEITFLNMDIQGCEVIALHRADKVLDQINAILTEFTLKPQYINGCTLSDLDNFLLPKGFTRVITEFADDACTWGDTFYVRT